MSLLGYIFFFSLSNVSQADLMARESVMAVHVDLRTFGCRCRTIHTGNGRAMSVGNPESQDEVDFNAETVTRWAGTIYTIATKEITEIDWK